jgi:hypothetical protein
LLYAEFLEPQPLSALLHRSEAINGGITMAVESQYGPKERAEYDTKERVVSTQKARSGIELQSMRYVLGIRHRRCGDRLHPRLVFHVPRLEDVDLAG